jgi:NAD(P) transhydrogenase subunit alpha
MPVPEKQWAYRKDFRNLYNRYICAIFPVGLEGFAVHPFILILIFVTASLVGYKLIGNVPSLLHTPLMSGMNALAGINLVCVLTVTGFAVHTGSKVLGAIAIILSMLNVAGGFAVTHRMLEMFRHKEDKK